MKKLNILNKAFYSNEGLEDANKFSLLTAVLVFFLVVTLLGLSSSYHTNQYIETAYVSHQETLDEMVSSSFEQFDNCQVDETLTFGCNSYQSVMLQDFTLIYQEEDYTEIGNFVGFFEDYYLIQSELLNIKSPYSFSVNYEEFSSQEDSLALANIHIISGLENSFSNTIYNDLSYSLLLMTINTLLVVSINTLSLRKYDKVKYNRRNLFKQCMLMALPSAVISGIISIMLTNVLHVLVLFAIIYNLRITFYVKGLFNKLENVENNNL